LGHFAKKKKKKKKKKKNNLQKKKKKKKGIKIGLKIRKLKHLNSSLFGPISVDFNLGNRKSRKVIEEILQQIIGRS
jgi:hypothetical protein